MPKSVSLIVLFDGEQQVGRLEVAMDDSRGVGMLEGHGDLDAVVDDVLPLELALLLDDAIERAAGDQLHRVPALVAAGAAAVVANDVRMLELLEDLHFALEPLGDLGVGREVRGEHFERRLSAPS